MVPTKLKSGGGRVPSAPPTDLRPYVLGYITHKAATYNMLCLFSLIFDPNVCRYAIRITEQRSYSCGLDQFTGGDPGRHGHRQTFEEVERVGPK